MCRRSGECKQQGVPFSKGMASYELKEIFIEAKTPTRHQYDSAGICRLSNRIFKSAKPGHILALETANSEIDIFFLVRVVKKEESLRKQEVFDDWGVTFKCPRHSQALKVVRLFPSSRESMWTFCDDVQKREFYVPAGLLRVEDLSSSMKTTHMERSIGARTRSRCAVDVTGDGSADDQPSCYYEVRAGTSRKEISHLCRLGLDYRYPPAAAGAGAGAGCQGAGTTGASGAHSLAAFFQPR